MDFNHSFDISPICFAQVSSCGEIVYANRSFCEFLGYTREELSTKKFQEITYPEDIDKDVLLFHRLTSGKIKDYRLQKRYIHKTGSLLWGDLFVSLSPRDQASGEQAIWASVVDITELKKHEQQLIEERSNFRTMFRNNPQAMGIYDLLNFKIMAVNQAACTLLGYSQQELIKMNVFDLLSPEQQVNFRQHSTNKENGVDNERKWSIICKSGKQRIIQSTSHIINFNGRTSRHAMLIDITESERITRELQSRESLISQAEQIAGMGSWEHDILKDVCRWSANLYRLLAFDKTIHPASFELFRERIHPCDQILLSHTLDRLQETKLTQETELRLQLPGSAIIWVHITIAPVFNRNRLVKLRGICLDITERKLQELAVKKNNDSIQQAQILAQMGSWEYDPRKDQAVWSENLYRILAVDPAHQDLSFNFVKSLLTPDDRILADATFTDLLKTPEKQLSEFQMKLPNGKNIWIENHIEPVFEHGELALIRGVIVDITERKKRENALLNLSKAVEQSPVSIAITNPDGVIEYVNPKFTAVTGYSREQALGQNQRLLKSGKMSEQFYNKLWETITSGKNWQGEIINKNRAGELYWENAIISPVFDQEGAISNFVAIKEDITTRKRLEKSRDIMVQLSVAVMQSEDMEAFFEMVFESLGQLTSAKNFFVALCDSDRKKATIPYCTQSCQHEPKNFILDHTLTGQVIQSGQSLLLSGDELTQHAHNGAKQLVGAPAKAWMGVPLMTKKNVIGALVLQSYDKDPLVCREDLHLVESIAPQLSWAFERKRTIEVQKETLVKLKESDRLKSSFLATISHELRTPLNPIIGFSNLLCSEHSDPTVNELAGIIHRSGNDMLHLLEDIFDLAFHHGQNVRCNPQPFLLVDLYSLARAYLEEALEIANKTNTIEILFNDIDIDICHELQLDKDKVLQVLNILMNNAVKFTEQGRIEFKMNIRHDPDAVCFSVSDTGIGIPHEKLDLIFNEFRQVEESYSRRHSGLGIGLAIARKLCDIMGAKLEVRSQVGEGSCFSLIVPSPISVREFDDTPLLDRLDEEPEILNGKTILLVDDNRFIFELTRLMLSKFDLRLLHVSNGLEAVKTAAKEKPDFILMDLIMPEMDGIDATRHIRSFLPRTPIAALTAHSMVKDRRKAFEAGCDTIITKPIHRDILLHVLRKYLSDSNRGKAMNFFLNYF
ncbi:PAS domain S-box protein [Mangrovibacterium marinum]|uniref:hybrid sensor histidine kinase/response regulator n=1 Tax=Mangrovibacterium marinum TaxID=1639118 RepID=UPI002A186BE7|nr:PAS domain S-box protein [Mangrovibacterium marinum]